MILFNNRKSDVEKHSDQVVFKDSARNWTEQNSPGKYIVLVENCGD